MKKIVLIAIFSVFNCILFAQNINPTPLKSKTLVLSSKYASSFKVAKFQSKWDLKKFYYKNIGDYTRGAIDLKHAYRDKIRESNKKLKETIQTIKSSSEDDSIKLRKTLEAIDLNQKEAEVLKLTIEVEHKLNYAVNLAYKRNKFFFLPARNDVTCKMFYNGGTKNIDSRIETFKNGNVKFFSGGKNGTGGVSIYNEFFAAYAGPVRIGFGGIISSSNLKTLTDGEIKDSNITYLQNRIKDLDSINKANNTMTRMLSGGGNFVLSGSYPLFEFNWDKFDSRFYAFANARIGLTMKGIDIENDNPYFVRDYQIQIAFNKKLLAEKEGSSSVNFFANGTFGMNKGNTEFYKELGVSAKRFKYLEVTGGFNVNVVRIYFTYSRLSKDVADVLKSIYKPFAIGVQFTPYY